MGTTPHKTVAELFRLMFVCTANRCRSPMAEVLAKQLLTQRHLDAEVVSAGRLEGGVEASAGAVAAMGRRGLDLSGHASARLDSDTLAHADLVLVMERSHLIDVYQTQPDALGRSFTLGEFPSLLNNTTDPPRGPIPDDPTQRARQRIGLADGARDRMRILVDDDSTDIADPMGRWNLHYRRTAKQLEELIEATFDGLFS